MQSAKGAHQFKFDGYDVLITPFSEKKLQITVVDVYEKIQFHEKLLVLNNIGTATLLKALERKMLEIKMDMKVKKSAESAVLEINVLVASQFLKPVQQVIYLKKNRDISESEILRNAVGLLSTKIKSFKQSDKNGPNIVRCGTVQQNQKSYTTGSSYDELCSITLPKGKYLITLSYLTKPTNQWMYLYFQQTQQCIQNCGFYCPSTTTYIPITIRKVYTVVNNGQKVTFNTYCAQSYPFTLRNVIMTAQEIV